MYTAASVLGLFRNGWRRKVLILHGHVLMTLGSKTTCLLRLGFATQGVVLNSSPTVLTTKAVLNSSSTVLTYYKGGLKYQFLLYLLYY